METPVRVAVLGATGYTGAELLRLLHLHPHVSLAAVFGHSKAGQPVADAVPSLKGSLDLQVTRFEVGATRCDFQIAFCALPHGASAATVAYLRQQGVTVFDLSADFRLDSMETYNQWYGEHGAASLFGSSRYGLVELHREELTSCDLVAVPGCYPTAAILALAPLLRADLVETAPIIVDAKSGVSGAGRSPGASGHFPEIGEGVRAYKAARNHRHGPEIEQELSKLGRGPVRVTFTPHLIPMSRGLLATCYAPAGSGTSAEKCSEAARELYRASPSVTVLPAGEHPDTAWVRGSNKALLSFAVDAESNMVVAQSAIDNLIKGAAGQAIQSMNVRFGFPEATALNGLPVWP